MRTGPRTALLSSLGGVEGPPARTFPVMGEGRHAPPDKIARTIVALRERRTKLVSASTKDALGESFTLSPA
jgi:hypothetical protein